MFLNAIFNSNKWDKQKLKCAIKLMIKSYFSIDSGDYFQLILAIC